MNRALMMMTCGAALLFAAGCGSGGSGGTGGSGGALAMTIRWPARVAGPLPSKAQAVRVTLFRGGDGTSTNEEPEVIAGPKLVSKPDNPEPGPAKILFDNLPPGPVRAEVKAYGTREGTDVPCASGSGSGLIELGRQTQILVEMFSHTYRVEVSPPSLQLAVGARQTLDVKAFDFNNNPLLGIGFHWFSQDPGIAEVDAFTGEVKANSTGTTQISAQEEFGTMTGTASVTVQ